MSYTCENERWLKELRTKHEDKYEPVSKNHCIITSRSKQMAYCQGNSFRIVLFSPQNISFSAHIASIETSHKCNCTNKGRFQYCDTGLP